MVPVVQERTIQVMNDAQHVREDLRTHLLPRKRQLTQQRDQLKAELQAANTVLVEHTNDHVGASSEPAPQGMVVVHGCRVDT